MLKLLKQFAQGSVKEKRQWSRRLSHEALAFLKNPLDSITLQPNTDKAPPWQNAGAEFLRKFYIDYMSKSASKFPEYFCSEVGAAKFGRNELLSEFKIINRISVCPACDEESYTRIDHYLPKSSYPNFVCHPYNLVPTCNTCNTDHKGEKDILLRKSRSRRKLEDMFLPYRGYGFKTDSYLKFSLKRGFRKPIIIGFKAQKGQDLCERVEVYRDAFSIPDRWRKKITEIEDSVYRQIQYSIQAHIDGNPSKQGNLNIFGLRDILDSLLSNLFKNQGNEKWRFPMTWYLVALINQEVEPAVHSSTPLNLENYALLQDLVFWLKQDTIPHPAHERSPNAQKLCNIAAGKE